ncbi:hypothetical protein Ahy_A03g010444 [Arachis hypogaea]|uniref:Reverse transcriptase zinc-binding domain-containing protein n=1 Tax=Arachis hypogaea TaxID=3818 RepID=A0A445DMA0_ARAHY|nr:hypothetical protein Ahy_A03g010444 [Arachis hypogaea]
MKRLTQINVVGANEVTCALCDLDDEDIDHLFIYCNYITCLWYKSKEVKSFFESWCEQEVMRVGRRRWINCWFAIVWVIQRIRNQIIFERNDIPWGNSRTYEFSRWICAKYVASKQCMAVGGYLVNAKNNIIVFLCEFLNADSRVNVLVECIETSVQFLLEE